jgi:predicted nucleic acid-binding protein
MQKGYLIDTQLYLSVLTLGEIRRGVEKLQAGERQRTLMLCCVSGTITTRYCP